MHADERTHGLEFSTVALKGPLFSEINNREMFELTMIL